MSRFGWGRSEAYADFCERASRADGPITSPLPVILGAVLPPPAPPWQPLITATQLPARIARGRPLHLLIRAVIAAVLALVVLQLIPGTAAAPADITGVILWFVLTARRDPGTPSGTVKSGCLRQGLGLREGLGPCNGFPPYCGWGWEGFLPSPPARAKPSRPAPARQAKTA